MTKKHLLFIALIALLTFIAGYQYKAWVYKDVCLDLGGGQNPGGYPICVIEK